MRLLVLGALGHIGSRFIHSLRPDDYEEVVLADNLSTQRYCSLFNLPEGVLFRFVEADICTADLSELFAGTDVVLHLAAITDAANSLAIRDQVERVNFEGTQRVAQACLVHGCRMIFPSTTSVYGTQKSVVDEDCPLEDLRPQSPYAESKLRAEQYLQSLGESDSLRFVILRLGTIFGVSIGMRFHTAINKFCWQACVGQPLTVWRTALHQERPYLDLEDAVRAFTLVIQTGRFDNQVYNVLTANATVGEIVEIIRSVIPGVRLEYVDAAIMNQLSYTVACEKFRSLGFDFRGSLSNGIAETIGLLRNVRTATIAQ